MDKVKLGKITSSKITPESDSPSMTKSFALVFLLPTLVKLIVNLTVSLGRIGVPQTGPTDLLMVILAPSIISTLS